MLTCHSTLIAVGLRALMYVISTVVVLSTSDTHSSREGQTKHEEKKLHIIICLKKVMYNVQIILKLHSKVEFLTMDTIKITTMIVLYRCF